MPEKCTDHPRDCPLVRRVEALEEANGQHSATHREMFKRLGDLEAATAVQDTQLKNIDEKLGDIKADQKTILAKVEALEAKPAKRWEGLVEKAVWAVCAAVIAFLLGRVGL